MKNNRLLKLQADQKTKSRTRPLFCLPHFIWQGHVSICTRECFSVEQRGSDLSAWPILFAFDGALRDMKLEIGTVSHPWSAETLGLLTAGPRNVQQQHHKGRPCLIPPHHLRGLLQCQRLVQIGKRIAQYQRF